MIRAATQQQARPLPSAELDAIAERLARLHLTHRDPERFHLEKFSLAAELRGVAREMRRVGQ